MNNTIIRNTWFKQQTRRLRRRKSPDNNTVNQIDYIMINKIFKSTLLSVKALPGADCNSDHIPLRANKSRTKNIKSHTKKCPKYQVRFGTISVKPEENIKLLLKTGTKLL